MYMQRGISMSVVIVGGNDRMAGRYSDICRSFDHKAKVFTQMVGDFESKIGTPDLILVLTTTCSHKMLGGVKRSSEKRGIPVRHINSSSASALKRVLEQIGEEKANVGA